MRTGLVPIDGEMKKLTRHKWGDTAFRFQDERSQIRSMFNDLSDPCSNLDRSRQLVLARRVGSDYRVPKKAAKVSSM